jgi:hypothetical protein
MTKTTTVTGNTGRTFLVRVVEYGDTYGRNDCLTHEPGDYDGGPMVEFYDTTNIDTTFPGRGQFVSRYYFDTLTECDARGAGLSLHGREREWCLPALAVTEAVAFAAGIVLTDTKGAA